MEDKLDILEVSHGDPSIEGRYHRFNKLLGKGAYKAVYKAFDTIKQVDVAWNSIDLFDESNQAIIATKDVNGDGNPIFISWTGGGATSTQAAMQDDFFSGGDVGIALTTASV